MLVGRNGATFSQQLFVDLRRAGWPVSPVLEGRIQIGGRSLRLLGIEPVTLPAEVGNAPAIGRAGLQSFVTPPGETLVAPETLSDLESGGRRHAVERATAHCCRRCTCSRSSCRACWWSISASRKRLLKMPDQISRLLIGKAKGERAPLENVAGDKLRLVEPDAESDLERLTDSFHLNLTAFGLLSFVVGLFIVNSAIGLAFEQRLPMLRTLRACGVSARMLNTVLVIELVSLALVAGVVGSGLRLPDRGGAAARCRRFLARPLWRANSRPVDAQGGMVDRRPRHQRRRRAGGGGHESCEGDPAVRCWRRRNPMPGNRPSTDG